MAWTWRYESAGGDVVDGPEVTSFPTQSDAESWLGETWQELLEAGVAAVVLLDADQQEYRMPLTPAS